MRVEAQRLKNSAEFLKIDLAKKEDGGHKLWTISDLKQCKKDWFKRHKRIFRKDKIFQSWLGVKLEAGYVKVPSTAISGHICIFSFLYIFK